MTDRPDFESRLQARLRARASLASRPFDAAEIAHRAVAVDGRHRRIGGLQWPSPRGSLSTMPGGHRNVGLLAAATLIGALLVGGAIAIGSGLVRLSPIVPPALDATLITSPPSPSTSPSVSPAPTPGLTPSVIGSGSWSVTGAPRNGGCCRTATLLRDGRLLLAGVPAEDGNTATTEAELYDPATGQWTETGSMTRWRYGPTAILKAISLPDGRVLVLGGHVSGSSIPSPRIPPGGGPETKGAETYDPQSGAWSWARPMTAPPETATLLPDGTVLVTHDGGSSELFDPRTGRWTATASPTQPLYAPAATLLANGDVLLVGMWDSPVRNAGCPCRHFVGRAELYDPLTGSWTPTGSVPAEWGTAALLADGVALVFGADGAARYDPQSGSWATVAAPPHEFLTTPPDDPYAAPIYWALSGGIAIRLLDGRVLAVGEAGAAGEAGAVLFDPTGNP